MSDLKRFLAKVQDGPSPTDCWMWGGAVGSDGYGRVRRRGKTHSAHRYAYELFKAEIPEALCVLHRCDTPTCVNPQHLFLGTPLDNTVDRRDKGRQGWSAHRLHWEDVQSIRRRVKAGDSKQKIAADFSVCRSTVQDIANVSSWASRPHQEQLSLF